MTSEESKKDKKDREGNRRAHRAALYANLRSVLVASLRAENPLLGLHGVAFLEQGHQFAFGMGMTPELRYLLGGVGLWQGFAIENDLERRAGNLKDAHTGDRYDPALGAPRCESCEGGDPTGEHAREELERNARAWLGLLIEIAERFYGEHLPAEALEPLARLRALALPLDTEVR